jgi:hypothetical protein
LQFSQFHLLSTDQKSVALLYANGLDLHLSTFLIERIQHAEAVIRPEAKFPGRLKWRGLPQRFPIAGLVPWLDLQLLFNLRANK